MPEGGAVVLFVALAVGGAYYGGQAAWKHAIKPASCGVVKVVTLGHKHCARKSKQGAPQSKEQKQ